MLFKTHLCKDFQNKCDQSQKVDERTQNLGFLHPTENPNYVFFFLKIFVFDTIFLGEFFAEVCLK